MKVNMMIEVISGLSDEMVFVLGDYMRDKEKNKEVIKCGIELCKTIIRGKDVDPESAKCDEIPDLIVYRELIKENKKFKLRNFQQYSPDKLIKKAKKAEKILSNILEDNKKYVNKTIVDIQNFFMNISFSLWTNTQEDLERKWLFYN